jgi:hypothetical protein
MPKNIDSIVGQLEELYKKLEYAFEDYAIPGDEALTPLNDAIDAIVEINNELDTDLEEE